MKEIVAISKNTFGQNQEVNTVSGRELHAYMDSGREYSNWIKTHLENNPYFEKGNDFITIDTVVKHSSGPGASKITDHCISFDCAKKIAMAVQTSRGNEVRDYFLKCERDLKAAATPKVMTRLELIQLAMDSEIAKIQAEAERDDAIRTKAQISDKKTATAMSTASKLSRENEKLKVQVGDSKKYKQVKAIAWLADVIDIKKRGAYSAVGKQLTRISKEIGADIRKIDDSRYGSINAYSIDAISALQIALNAGNTSLKNYRRF